MGVTSSKKSTPVEQKRVDHDKHEKREKLGKHDKQESLEYHEEHKDKQCSNESYINESCSCSRQNSLILSETDQEQILKLIAFQKEHEKYDDQDQDDSKCERTQKIPSISVSMINHSSNALHVPNMIQRGNKITILTPGLKFTSEMNGNIIVFPDMSWSQIASINGEQSCTVLNTRNIDDISATIYWGNDKEDSYKKILSELNNLPSPLSRSTNAFHYSHFQVGMINPDGGVGLDKLDHDLDPEDDDSPVRITSLDSPVSQSKVTITMKRLSLIPHDSEESHDKKTEFSHKCLICGENDAKITLIPCGHLILCNSCSMKDNKLKTCPVCSAIVKNKIKFIF